MLVDNEYVAPKLTQYKTKIKLSYNPEVGEPRFLELEPKLAFSLALVCLAAVERTLVENRRVLRLALAVCVPALALEALHYFLAAEPQCPIFRVVVVLCSWLVKLWQLFGWIRRQICRGKRRGIFQRQGSRCRGGTSVRFWLLFGSSFRIYHSAGAGDPLAFTQYEIGQRRIFFVRLQDVSLSALTSFRRQPMGCWWPNPRRLFLFRLCANVVLGPVRALLRSG
mmetsp:Transcript_806/g.2604  ORF Transcript_806/g.2604 Transcript_806/m.2604 type:complete len:224 (+) Transcript_806:3920-4591(+)